ncbi:ABC transporter, ATP-binding protein [Teredinibacter turnerae T7901]|uniref:ABC transporter, ATP-binding protein n=1 Tax=Teredinibacter turnerae (strain ATCC 39867 / T7901) TaxID=377629 RepID=C5BK37_TERTT|nr:ABC transporter ATP-binding protein [Teredinibacter turnerae]ACR10648.1 ABC transporter, ATP-binding protein [Teredinibacter turnerae T7901]
MDSVSISEVSKKYIYKGKAHLVVDEISFDIRPGEIFGLLGVNGAGKTTTIKMISGLTIPDSGTVRIFGLDPSNSKTQKLIGTILEGNRNLYWQLTALENLVYFGVLKGMSIAAARKKGAALMEEFQFDQYKDLLVQNMSRGMQQKLAIKVALMHEPKVLILDEPTLGLDVPTKDFFSRFISDIAKNMGISILLTSHDLEFVGRTSNSFGVIQNGKLVKYGKMQELNAWIDDSGYRVILADELGGDEAKQLEKFGGKVIQENHANFLVSKEHLYQFLDAVKPANIINIKSLANDLEELLLNTRLEK